MTDKSLELRGLVGSNPLGALAAFGLLRVLAPSLPEVRLSWRRSHDWIAVLHGGPWADPSHLTSHLVDWFSQRPTDDLDWTLDDVRVGADAYRRTLRDAVTGSPWLAERLQAFAADGAIDQQKQLVKPTAFFMASGQMSWLGGLREIHRALRSDGALWSEALFGPWRYATALHSLGWDPAGERLHALRGRAPTAEKPRSVAAATWLAFEALSSYPAFGVARREQTVGFRRTRGGHAFAWPIWTDPLDLDTVELLLQADLTPKPTSTAGRPGVAAVFRSARFTFGQGYAVFRPAERVV